MVRTSLVDDEANVRSAAARAFDILQEHLGTRAIDQTIPTLLEALRQPGASSGTALQALKEVMSVSFSLVSPSCSVTYLTIGASHYSLPRAYSYSCGESDVAFQRSSLGHTGYRRRKRVE
jgi:hypothetical protein